MIATAAAIENNIPQVTKLADTWIESEEKPTYHGWPTVTLLQDGRLAVVSSGNRTKHVDPFGRVLLYISEDEGATWQKPVRLSNGPLDDRDAGIIQLKDGTILVNYFTSLAFFFSGIGTNWPKVPSNWKEAVESVTLSQVDESLGQFILRSTDGGKSWEPKRKAPVGNVHGPCQLQDGSLLWVGKEVSYKKVLVDARYDRGVIACRSTDGGKSWQKIADIPKVEGQDQSQWHELHQIQAADGTIICHIRNHAMDKKTLGITTWQCESHDNGVTWTVPHMICYGVCNHLVNLPDGRMIMTYGYRRVPYGVRFRVSSDFGRTWSEEAILCNDGDTADIGYPSSVVLSDGSLATVWYQYRESTGVASLRCLRWHLHK